MWHDKSIQKKQFQPGDWVLLYDSRFEMFKGKFHTCWMGPYKLIRVFENGAVEFKTINGKNFVFLVNGHRFMVYFQPLTKGNFMQQVQWQSEKDMVGGNTNLLKILFFLFLEKI